jgi:sugar lactone lactonase YvrE
MLAGAPAVAVSSGITDITALPTGAAQAVALFDSGKKAVVVGSGEVYLVDIETDKLVTTLTPPPQIDGKATQLAGVAIDGKGIAYVGANIGSLGREGTIWKFDTSAAAPNTPPPSLTVVAGPNQLNTGSGEPAIAGQGPKTMIVSKDGTSIFVRGGTRIRRVDTATGTVEAIVPQGSSGTNVVNSMALAPDGNTLYATISGGQFQLGYKGQYVVADVRDPKNITQTLFTLNDSTFGDKAAAVSVSGDSKSVYFAYKDSTKGPAVRQTIVAVFDASDMATVKKRILFNDDEAFDVYNVIGTFGQVDVVDMAVGPDPKNAGNELLWILDGAFSYSGVYDLGAGKWKGLADFSDGIEGGLATDLIDGGAALVTGNDGGLHKVPLDSHKSTKLPSSELQDSKPAVDVARFNDGLFVLANSGEVSIRKNDGFTPDSTYPIPAFSGRVQGTSTALASAAESEVFVKTQDGTTGRLYKLGFGLDLVSCFCVDGGWLEVPAPPEGFPEVATGANDIATSPDGSTVYAISKTGIAVYKRGIRSDATALPLEPDTYDKTIQVSGALNGLSAAADDKSVYATTEGRVVRVDLSTGAVVATKDLTADGLTTAGALAPSKDGTRLFVGTKDSAGNGQVTTLKADTLETVESLRDDDIKPAFDPVGLAFGAAPTGLKSQMWIVGGPGEQAAVSFPEEGDRTARNLWGIADIQGAPPTPAPGKDCRAIVPLDEKTAAAACEGGLYLVRAQAVSFPAVQQPTGPTPGQPSQSKPPMVGAPSVPVPGASAGSTPTSPSLTTPDKTTSVTAKSVAKGNKLKVRVRPEPSSKKQWKFKVLKKKGGKFVALKKKGKVKVYRTKTAKHTKTLNLKKGKYKVKVLKKRGYTGSTSKVVKLKR